MSVKIRNVLVVVSGLLLQVLLALLTLYTPGYFKLLFLLLMILNIIFVRKTLALLRKIFRVPENKDVHY